MENKMKDYTFSLPVDLIEQLNNYCKNESIDDVVAHALTVYLQSLSREQLYNDILCDSKNSLFAVGMKSVLNKFY